MPGKHGSAESTKKHVASKKQRRFFYAVASGTAKKDTSMTPEQAKHHLAMDKKQKGNLPEEADIKSYVKRHGKKRAR